MGKYVKHVGKNMGKYGTHVGKLWENMGHMGKKWKCVELNGISSYIAMFDHLA